MRNVCLLWLYLLLLSSSNTSYGAGILKLTKSMAVIGQPLILKYENDMSNITQRVAFVLGTLVQGVCEDLTVVNGLCGSGRGHNVTRISSHVITLEIPSFDATVNAGTWKVQEGSVFSNEVDFTVPFATIVTNSSINITNAIPTQDQISSEKDFNISTVIDCAYPSVNVSWVFGDSQILTPVITTDGTGCNSPLVNTIAVLTMNDKSMSGKVAVSVKLIHPSFENEVLYLQLGDATFPASPATTSNSATTSTIPSQSPTTKPTPTTTTKPTPIDWLFYVYIAAGVVGAVVFGIIVICCCRCHKVCCFKNSNESHDSPEDNKSQPYTNNVYAVVKKPDKERPESDVSYKSTCGFVDIDLNPSNLPTALQSGLPKSDPSQPVSRAPRGNPLHDDIDLPSYKSSSRGPKNKSDDNGYTFYTGQGGTSDRPGEKAYDRLHVGERGYEGSGERGYEMLGEGGKVTGREYANVKKSEGLARL